MVNYSHIKFKEKNTCEGVKILKEVFSFFFFSSVVLSHRKKPLKAE